MASSISQFELKITVPWIFGPIHPECTTFVLRTFDQKTGNSCRKVINTVTKKKWTNQVSKLLLNSTSTLFTDSKSKQTVYMVEKFSIIMGNKKENEVLREKNQKNCSVSKSLCSYVILITRKTKKLQLTQLNTTPKKIINPWTRNHFCTFPSYLKMKHISPLSQLGTRHQH